MSCAGIDIDVFDLHTDTQDEISTVTYISKRWIIISLSDVLTGDVEQEKKSENLQTRRHSWLLLSVTMYTLI